MLLRCCDTHIFYMLEDEFLAISILVYCILVVSNVKGYLGKWKAQFCNLIRSIAGTSG